MESREDWSYEQALSRLRTVVEQLERQSFGLEESLALFEEGMQLSRLCDGKLRDVEQRVRVLVERGDSEQMATSRGDLELEMEMSDEPDEF